MKGLQDLQSLEQFELLKSQDKPVVFVFSANWCPDCHFIEPFMPQLVQQYPDLEFIHVNRDHFMELAQSLMVLGIPSFIAFKNNQELGRFVSKLRKTRAEIEAFLSNLI